MTHSVRPQPAAPTRVAMARYQAPVSPLVVGPAEAPARPPAVAPPETSQLEQFADAEFQYTGSGRLTVTGPITGKVYYFSTTSETILVHGADAPSLVSVPGLKIVS